MRQVPNKNSKSNYLIVGNGNLAGHFRHYFNLVGLHYLSCTRKNLNEFVKLSDKTDRILLLIRDDEIESFIKKHRDKISPQKNWIHCSGVLSIDEAESAHPLASFSNVMFDKKFYSTIPFITEKGRKTFRELFPQLHNPSFEITKEQKEIYHAWCSMAGNFTTILWQNFFSFLEKDLHLQFNAAYPFLSTVSQNLIHSYDPLTGPLKRGDSKTIERHLHLLKDSPLEDVYKSFVKLYEKNFL